MATTSWVGGSINQTPGNTTVYLGLYNPGEVSGTELNAKMLSAGGTYSMMSIFVSANGGNTATLTSRVNGANGNQTISIGSGATGWFQDTTHSDTVVDGDLVNMKLVTGSGITYKGCATMMFSVAGSGATTYLGQGVEMMGTNFTTGNQNNYLGGIATIFPSPVVAAQITTRAAGTYSKLSVLGNTNGQVPHTRLLKNTVAGNLDIAEGAGSSGVLQTDTTHTDTVSSGDTISLLTSTTGTSRWAQISVRFVSSDSKFEIVRAAGPSNVGSGTHFLPIFGADVAVQETTEANANAKAPTVASITKLRLMVGSNALSGGSQVFTLRKNGADGNNTVTVPVTTTGLFEDTTHTDAIAAGDLVCVKCVGSNSSGSSQFTMALLVDQAAAAFVTAATTTTLVGVSQEILANLVQTAGITTALTGISQQILATRTVNATMVTTLQGISQALLAHTVRGPGLGRRQFWTS